MAATAPTLALYRALVPAHAAVVDATVEVYLDQAEEQHTQSAWGNRYDAAMVYFAAHLIQRTPAMGVGTGTAEEAGALTTIASSDIQRSYAVPRGRTPEDADLRTTRYGQLYLQIRDSRAVTAPFALGPSRS